MTAALLDCALAWHAAGGAPVPLKPDGSKRPGLDRWRDFIAARPTADEVRALFARVDTDGLGLVCGAASGGLEMLEVEGRAAGMVEALDDVLADHGYAQLWGRLTRGYVEQSPSGGLHWLYRVAGPARGNTRLARDEAGEVLIETRGEGGFTVVAPSAGRSHPTGRPWVTLCGTPATVPVVTVDERDALYALATLLDRAPLVEPGYVVPAESTTTESTGAARPGDDYNARVSWEDILPPHGWVRAKPLGAGWGWTRPGKRPAEGISATTGTSLDGVDRLYVFSTSTAFVPERPYDKFGALAVLDYGGDLGATARALSAAGYGSHDDAPALTLAPGLFVPQAPAQGAAPASAVNGNGTVAHRHLVSTPSSGIGVRPVHWLWSGRIALGTLALLGGREGVGKSTVAYTLAAMVTRGVMEGVYFGQPKAVIVAATEDSWSHTIVPRLMAAGADLALVYRVEALTAAGVDTALSLPIDLADLAETTRRLGAALILLDPLMSRLAATLDTHKDAEVRTALEPLVTLADRAGCAVLGLIHVNKSGSADPLTALMGSRAFAAVARAVLFVMADPDNADIRLFGQPKNNLGRVDLPTLTFTIDSAHVADTPEGPVWTGRLHWVGEYDRPIAEVFGEAGDGGEVRTAVGEAAGWLTDYLTIAGGTADSAALKREGAKAGHTTDALKRARTKLRLTVTAEGYPRRTWWTLPNTNIRKINE